MSIKRKMISAFIVVALLVTMIPATGGTQAYAAGDAVIYASELPTDGSDLNITANTTLVLDADAEIGQLSFSGCTLTIKDDSDSHTLKVSNVQSPAAGSNLIIEKGTLEVIGYAGTPAYCAYIGGDVTLKAGRLYINHITTSEVDLIGLYMPNGTLTVNKSRSGQAHRINLETAGTGATYGAVVHKYVHTDGYFEVLVTTNGEARGAAIDIIDKTGGIMLVSIRSKGEGSDAIGLTQGKNPGDWVFSKAGAARFIAYAPSPGCGTGIALTDENPSLLFEVKDEASIDGTGHHCGIYVKNRNVLWHGELVSGMAFRYGGAAIFAECDITIEGSANVEAWGDRGVALYVKKNLNVGGVANVIAKGYSADKDHCAIRVDGDLITGSTIYYSEPEGAYYDSEQKMVLDADGNPAVYVTMESTGRHYLRVGAYDLTTGAMITTRVESIGTVFEVKTIYAAINGGAATEWYRQLLNDETYTMEVYFGGGLPEGWQFIDWTRDYNTCKIESTEEVHRAKMGSEDIWWYAVFKSPSGVNSGWSEECGRWYYYQNSKLAKGWLLVGSQWYFFDRASGIMQHGWIKDNGKWYYLGYPGSENSGAMRTGWIQVDGYWYYLSSTGAMLTGWQTINGKTYYLKSSGAMASREYVNGWWLNANGSWTYPYQASWKLGSKGWWYGDASGWYARSATYIINDKTYTFDASGWWIAE